MGSTILPEGAHFSNHRRTRMLRRPRNHLKSARYGREPTVNRAPRSRIEAGIGWTGLTWQDCPPGSAPDGLSGRIGSGGPVPQTTVAECDKDSGRKRVFLSRKGSSGRPRIGPTLHEPPDTPRLPGPTWALQRRIRALLPGHFAPGKPFPFRWNSPHPSRVEKAHSPNPCPEPFYVDSPASSVVSEL